MTLRLVTAGDRREAIGASDGSPATGIMIGVFSGSMFWIGLAIGWTLWG